MLLRTKGKALNIENILVGKVTRDINHLDKNTFFIKEDYPIEISNIEIPKEYWENEKLLDYYNKTHREVTLMQLRNQKTDCIMEKDVKKWFFDKYDSG